LSRTEFYDLIVVGARVAGSVVASVVGDAGYRVLLVDRDSFPSATLSTHYFRGAGMVTVLKKLGLLEDVFKIGAPKLIRQYTYMDGTSVPTIEGPQEPGEMGYCLSVRRESLDYLLIKRACHSDRVTFMERTAARELMRDGNGVTGMILHNEKENEEIHAKARFVVGADGRSSLVARQVNPEYQESFPPIRALYYCYVRNFKSPVSSMDLDGPEFSQIGDELYYVFPSDSGFTCVALTLGLDEFQSARGSPAAYFKRHIANHKGIAKRFFDSEFDGSFLVCGPTPNYVRVPFGKGWALVGDAGLHQDPWSGRGMDMASVHATFLAQELIRFFAGEVSEHEALSRYHRRRDEHGIEVYRNTVRIGKDLSQETTRSQ
jgi:flavin-dependent dehydrogenase